MRPKLAVLRLRDFRLVFGPAAVSLLGDGIVPVALAFAVLDLTGSATDLGIVLAAYTVALVSSLLVGGVVADRLGRRRVMVAADLARLLSQATIGGLLVSGHASVAGIALSQVVLGVATGFFNPASSGLIPDVAGPWLQQANTLRGIAMAVGAIAGPAIAGILVVVNGPGEALLIDAGTYGASALLLARVRSDATSRSDEHPHFFTDLRAGFTVIRQRTWLWSTIVVSSLVNMIAPAILVLGPLVAKRAFGGAPAWAAILAVGGVGSLLGGLALLRFTPRRPLLAMSLIGLPAAAPALLLAGPASLWLILVAALIAGAAVLLFNTLWETTMQQHIPVAARSRVSAYDWFGSLAMRPLGLALIGPLAGAIGVSGALYLCGGLELAATASLLLVKEVRTLPPRAAPAEPEEEARLHSSATAV
jgi:MFS family permease